MQLIVTDEELTLLPEKVLWLPAHRMLVVADVHLGKITHFRKGGLYVPAANGRDDLSILRNLCERLQPVYLVFLGDLFHSTVNSEWYLLERMLCDLDGLQVLLIRGNHDLVPEALLEQSCISQVEELAVGRLLLTHHPLAEVPSGMLNVAGHVHPGYLLHAPARQYFRLPCFYLKPHMCLLPAFGSFTGLHLLQKEADSRIFVIAGQKIYPV